MLILEHPLNDGGRFPFNQLLLSLAKGIQLSWTQKGRVRRMEPRSLVALTASGDAFDFPELEQWSYRIECRQEHHQPGFDLTSQLREVNRWRSRILSGIFQLFATDVVPGLAGRRIEVLEQLSKEHPGHAKNRLDSFLALMALIQRALLGTLHGDASRAESEADRMLKAWVEDQGRNQPPSTTATLLANLTAVMLASSNGDFAKEYYLEFKRHKDKNGQTVAISFEASSKQLLRCFQIMSHLVGISVPFKHVAQLSVRLKHESERIRKDGWEMSASKVVRGERFYRFQREVV